MQYCNPLILSHFHTAFLLKFPVKGFLVQLDFGGPPKFKSGLNPVFNLARGLNKELITTMCQYAW